MKQTKDMYRSGTDKIMNLQNCVLSKGTKME